MLLLLKAQPLGRRHVIRPARTGLEPRLNGLSDVGVAAEAKREAHVAKAQFVLVEQLAEGAQTLELPGP